MKLIIDIPDKTYHKIIDGTYDYGDMNIIIRNGTPLDDMTNGEVLQALFPYVKTEDTSFNMLIGTNLDKSYAPLSREWWDSPYQKGGE